MSVIYLASKCENHLSLYNYTLMLKSKAQLTPNSEGLCGDIGVALHQIHYTTNLCSNYEYIKSYEK